MTFKISGTVDLDQTLNRLITFIFGSTSSRLIALGVGLMSVGSREFILYAFQTVVLKDPNATLPGSEFGWLERIGFAVFCIGIVIPLRHWIKKSKESLGEERTKFKETFKHLSDVRLQDEFERLYGARGVDVYSIKAILSHPSNVNRALSLFLRCRANVEYTSPWFSFRDRFFKFRYKIGFLFWLLLPLHASACILMASVELYSPGILKYGPYAAPLFGSIFLLDLVGAWLIMTDLCKMGTAITLVERFRPPFGQSATPPAP